MTGRQGVNLHEFFAGSTSCRSSTRMAMMTNVFALVPMMRFSSALSKIFKLLETTHSEKGTCVLINIYSTTFDIITAQALITVTLFQG